MPALNFHKQFVPAIEAGKKTQTIRQYRKQRNIIAGDALYLYTGMRTKACRKIADAWCVSAQPVEIGEGHMLIGIMHYHFPEALNHQAKKDGFANFDEMKKWFRKHYGLPFSGRLIRWSLR